MLKKSLLANAKAFKVSIGSQTYCTVSSNKAFASPGEVVTLTVSYSTGYSNATVSVSPSVVVNKVNANTYTFVMPSSDVMITASASVLSFSIYVNKSGSGTVNVKSVANYGERVTVTLSPADRHSLQSISSSDVTLSGDGNTRTFVMPARNVTLTVAFQEYHVVITVGYKKSIGIEGYGYSTKNNAPYGSIDRIPYWNSPDVYLTKLESTFINGNFSQDLLVTNEKHGLSAMVVNGKSMRVYDIEFRNTNPPPLVDSSLKGKEVRIKFTPPLPDISNKVKQVFTRSQKEGVVNAWEGNAYRVGYTRKGKYHQRHGLHCTGDPRWKFSLDYTSWQDRKGQRTYRGCGISIFPRLGWKLARAYHHEHIEKYITHWLYRFPSKTPNGGLIRRDHRNLGVTSQLEVSYAA